MSTITKKMFGNRHYGSAPPYGNLSVRRFNLTLNASGVIADSDDATVVAIGDIVRVGVIPGGMRLDDFQAIISNAWKAATTCKIGFQYVDGVDDANVPEDDDYFIPATQALSSAAILRKTATTAPVILPKDAYLIVTIAGAEQDEASVTDFAVIGEIVGPV
jgi:hypothetical protein